MEIVKQGKHLRIVVDTDNGVMTAYIDDYSVQVYGEVWGTKLEDFEKNLKRYRRDGIDYLEIEYDGLITYYSDGTLEIQRSTIHNSK